MEEGSDANHVANRSEFVKREREIELQSERGEQFSSSKAPNKKGKGETERATETLFKAPKIFRLANSFIAQEQQHIAKSRPTTKLVFIAQILDEFFA
jgi:hypothetical protein